MKRTIDEFIEYLKEGVGNDIDRLSIGLRGLPSHMERQALFSLVGHLSELLRDLGKQDEVEQAYDRVISRK